MTNVSTNAGPAEVTSIDMQARGPLLLLVGSAIVWLVISGILAVITSIQLHSPGFLADCPWLTYGRSQALRETAFIYGWAANAGLGVSLWVMARLGGYPLRASNWAIVGTLFWNIGVTTALIGIAAGDMTTFSLFQMPRYVQPLLAFAYAAVAISGVLAWSGRRSDSTFASHWYAIAGLVLFPWMLCAAQAVLLWWPVRGTVQAIAAGWYAQGVWTLWLAPLALAGAYYIVPKTAGRVLPTYESAPLGFWTLMFVGAWTGGRHLVGGPVPAWVPTMAVVASALLLFHYLVIGLNLRLAFQTSGTAIKFIRVGLVAYLLGGMLELLTSFRSVAMQSQFTFLTTAFDQLGAYGALSMMFFGGIYYMVPRITGNAWVSEPMVAGHRIMVIFGVVLSIVTFAVAGLTQGDDLLDPKMSLAHIFSSIRLSLLMNSGAQIILLAANFLLMVNFFRTACVHGFRRMDTEPASSHEPALKVEAHA
jgi:cytochrome c oxidase cbb3-type subunit I